MDTSLKTGFMAVFAVSGSVVFLAVQAHKRLLSNFIKEMEFEIKNPIGDVRYEPRKKVKFVDEAVAEKAYGKKHPSRRAAGTGENLEDMPQNWQAMYRGILQYRNLRGNIY